MLGSVATTSPPGPFLFLVMRKSGSKTPKRTARVRRQSAASFQRRERLNFVTESWSTMDQVFLEVRRVENGQ